MFLYELHITIYISYFYLSRVNCQQFFQKKKKGQKKKKKRIDWKEGIDVARMYRLSMVAHSCENFACEKLDESVSNIIRGKTWPLVIIWFPKGWHESTMRIWTAKNVLNDWGMSSSGGLLRRKYFCSLEIVNRIIREIYFVILMKW